MIEGVLPEGDEPHCLRFGDIVMMVALGGRERTRGAYAALLDKARFRLERVVATKGPRSIREALPC